MGFIYVQESVHSTAIKDENTHNSAWVDVSKCDRVSVLVNVVKTSTPGDLTLTLEGSADQGTTAITLDFEDAGGMGGSEAYSATADDALWLKPGLTPPWIRVALDAAATTDTSKYWTPKIWVIGYRT